MQLQIYLHAKFEKCKRAEFGRSIVNVNYYLQFNMCNEKKLILEKLTCKCPRHFFYGI